MSDNLFFTLRYNLGRAQIIFFFLFWLLKLSLEFFVQTKNSSKIDDLRIFYEINFRIHI